MVWFRLFIIFLLIKSSLSFSYEKSDHFDGSVFYNLDPMEERGLFDILKWRIFEDRFPWPEWIENKKFSLPQIAIKKGISYTFINHASVLIQTPNLNIITDPIYSKRASPVSLVGPLRVRNPGVSYEDLPQLMLFL